jgi:hypothetical protein
MMAADQNGNRTITPRICLGPLPGARYKELHITHTAEVGERIRKEWAKYTLFRLQQVNPPSNEAQ